MKRLALFIVICGLLSCRVYNTASRDKLYFGSGVDPDTNFGKAFSVITNKCVSCHAKFGSWTTEQAWITNGYVVAQTLSESKVYYRLFGSNLGVDIEDMPSNSSLTSGELADIRNWINNM